MTTPPNISDLKRELQLSPELQKQFREDPVKAIQQYENPLDEDKWVYRIVVLSLGLTIFSIVVGVIVLVGMDKITSDKTVPTLLTAVGSAAIGAMAGLLVPSPRKQS